MTTVANNGVSALAQWLMDSIVLTAPAPVPAGPCTCKHPRETCSVCRANMDNRAPGALVDPVVTAQYGTPTWQMMAAEYRDEAETTATLRQF